MRGDLVLVEEVLPTDSAELIFFEHAAQHHLSHRANWKFVGGDLHSSSFPVVDLQHLFNVAVPVGTIPEEHLEQNDSARPNVSFAPVDISVKYLWGHVEGRSKGGMRKVVCASEFFAEAEVS